MHNLEHFEVTRLLAGLVFVFFAGGGSRIHNLKGTLIGSVVLAELMLMTNRETDTHRQTQW